MNTPLNLTLLAAALLVATAPSAAATCVPVAGCGVGGQVGGSAGEVVGIGTGAANQAIGIAFGALDLAESVAAEQTADLDGDDVPDEVEPLLCSNNFLRGLINQDSVPGACPTETDYEPPSEIGEALATAAFVADLAVDTATNASAEAQRIAGEAQRQAEEAILNLLADVNELIVFAEGEADKAVALVDEDHDNVADVLEPVICDFVEFSAIEEDGSCTGHDYDPWV